MKYKLYGTCYEVGYVKEMPVSLDLFYCPYEKKAHDFYEDEEQIIEEFLDRHTEYSWEKFGEKLKRVKPSSDNKSKKTKRKKG